MGFCVTTFVTETVAFDNRVRKQNIPHPNPEPRPSCSRRDAEVAADLRIRDALQDEEM